MIDVTDSFIEPRMKSGQPKLSTRSSPKANKRRDNVTCVGGMWNGKPWARCLFVEDLATVSVGFSPRGPLLPTRRFKDGPKVRGKVPRVPDGFDLVRLLEPSTHMSEHRYRLNPIDDRAYWDGLAPELVEEQATDHVAKADERARKRAEKAQK